MKELILMPKELTAENGAKALLIGEFFTEVWMDCGCMDEDGNPNPDCDICNGKETYLQKTDISWTTIKAIYAMAVKHLGGNLEDYNQKEKKDIS